MIPPFQTHTSHLFHSFLFPNLKYPLKWSELPSISFCFFWEVVDKGVAVLNCWGGAGPNMYIYIHIYIYINKVCSYFLLMQIIKTGQANGHSFLVSSMFCCDQHVSGVDWENCHQRRRDGWPTTAHQTARGTWKYLSDIPYVGWSAQLARLRIK